MSKKRVIIFILLFTLIGIQVSDVIALTDNIFFNVNKQEISQEETLEMTLDISKIEYDEFEFKLSSNLDTNNIIINENVKVENYNNDISINIDKAKTNLDKITFYYKVPEDAQVGTKIELSAQIIIAEENEDEMQYKSVENKKIEINIVNNKQNNNQEQTNENNNYNSKTQNNQDTNTFPKKEKQDVSISNDEKKESDNYANTIKSKSSIKTQNTTYSVGTVDSGDNKLAQEEKETAVYKGSNNNYLSNIEVEGENLNTIFRKDNTTYFIETKEKTYLNVNVVKEDQNSKVYITGNDNLKIGDNKILISVIAENGYVRYYKIFVTNK